MMEKRQIKSFTILLLAVLLIFSGCKEKRNRINEQSDEEVVESKYFYGIKVDSLDISSETIQRNSFLADILLKHNVDYAKIHELTEKSEGIFDFRKIRTGQNYYILQRQDSTRTSEFFIYEKNVAEYVVCDLRDSVCVYMGQKPIRVEEKTASGIINSSLYMTLDENNLHPTLALSLSSIYAWTIDFYHLQKGDKFKVIYEEKFVDSISLGISDIKAAVFDHYGREIYANKYMLEGDSVYSYYDAEGESLQKTFLKSPLKFGRLTSKFSYSRVHPVTGQRKGHFGTDYAAPTGTPIMSTANGVVIEAAYKKYNGNYVKVKHNSTYTTQYLHMSKIAAGIRPGKHVSQGDIIGYVGSTGLATGPHVCYRFWKFGQQVDPAREELPPSDPVPAKELPQYMAHFDSVKVHLDKIDYPAPPPNDEEELADN
ncbi:MAG: peptidoglycan DD-metalloendopeptidase family protein [Bacteroidetes bacterium]|nr:peptidoglycan DD-metalloendopeptidase family protein [Bacteroidota bacterium]